MSPYKAAKLVNGWIAEAGIAKELPPQMFYTYAKKGMIRGDSVPTTDITEADLMVWYVKYAAKNLKLVLTPAE